MKNNTFKRVLAGSLALLTVAAPMSANVGGILQEVAVVANAATSAKLTVSWKSAMCDYIQSISFGGETISGTQVSKSTNYVFENVAGEVATIATTVPIESTITTNFGGYDFDDETEQKEQNYKFDKGHWRVSEKNGVYTYEIYTKDDFCKNPVTLAIDGDQEAYTLVSFDGTATTMSGNGNKPKSIDKFVTTVDSTTEGHFYKNGYAKLTSTDNFTVRVFDGTKSTSVVNVVVEYDTVNKKYEATFKMPTYTTDTAVAYTDAAGVTQTPSGSVIIEVVKQDPEALSYTADKNTLYANGNTVAADSVAAQITAKQQRAEVRDAETNALIDEAIKESDLAYNGQFKYGTKAGDGVTVTVKRDATLTIKNNQSTGSEQDAYAVFNVTKDGTVYDGWENQIVGSSDAVNEAGKGANFDANNSFTFPKFTNAGTYEITAKFYYRASNGGVDTKTINYKFTINPIDLAASDVAIMVDYAKTDVNGDKTVDDNDNLVTPIPAYFDKDGVLELVVPDELKGTTFDATVTVPKMDEAKEDAIKQYQEEFDKFVKAIQAAQTAHSGEANFRLMYNNNPYLRAETGNFRVSEDLKTVTANGAYIKGTWSRDTYADLPALYEGTKNGTDSFTVGNQLTAGYKVGVNEFRYEIDGTLTATDFNVVNNVKVLVYDQNYGAPYSTDNKKFKTISLKYKLVKAAQSPAIEPLPVVHPDLTDDGVLRVAAADCKDLDAFKEIFWNNYKGNEIVEENKDKISFEYLEGMSNSAASDDLDSHNPGLPTKKSDINYTLFVLFDGVTFTSIPLEVVNTKAMIVPADAELTKTFGDKVEFTNYTITDANGKKLSSIKLKDIYVQVLGTAADKNKNTAAIEPYKDGDGKYVIAKKAGQIIRVTDPYLLNAGTYVVKFSSDLDSDVDYTVNSAEYILTIEKRQITGDMFTAPNIPFDGYQKEVSIDGEDTNGGFTFRYTAGNKVDYAAGAFAKDGMLLDDQSAGATISDLFKVSGGDTKGTATGEYTIRISANKNNENFTGTAEVNWYVAYQAETKSGIGFTWKDADIWLYDKGRIHATYEPSIIPKTGSVTIDGKKVTVKDYGVICDKDAKIKAPNIKDNTADDYVDYEQQKKGGKYNSNASYITAAKTLLYGNGYIEGHASDDCWTRGDYGANISVKAVDKGIWVRPYILLSNDKVVYGDPIYLDIVKEAEKQLQFQLNPAVKLDNTNNLPGYDYETGKYVFYSSYKKFDTKVQAKVQDFGVIVDKKGSFKEVNGTVVSASDERTSIEDAFKFGKGFVEGHFNPNNEKLGANEYGAKIKPADFVTGVWVRGYIKLSDDLIVYTKPEYYNSVSDFYGADKTNTILNRNAAFASYMASTKADAQRNFDTTTRAVSSNKYKFGNVTPSATVDYTNTTGIYQITFTNNVKANNSKLEFVAQGVVVDKSEGLVTRNYAPGQTDVYTYTIKDTANTKLVLGKGYKEGSRTDATKDYVATVSPLTGRAITARPYTTFKVAGTDTTVTVYGEPVAKMMSNATTTWTPKA